MSLVRERCQGHALCAKAAPAVYELDELGYSTLTKAAVEPGRENEALRGARSCPERAIVIEAGQ